MTPEQEKEISICKMKLYHALLKKDSNELTDNEVDIAYLLSKDADIQKIIDEALQLM
jgi:hypothetical protein